MKKKLLSAILCTAMVSTLFVGCGGGNDSADTSADAETTEKTEESADAGSGSHKCGFVVGSFEHVFYQTIRDGIESKAKELGMEAIVTDAELDPNIATNKVQDLTAQGCEAIALSCNDAAGVKPAIENADAEGVAMFTFDCSTDSEAINCFVGTDNYKGGQLGGQELLKYSEDGDTVGIICYPTALPVLTDRTVRWMF